MDKHVGHLCHANDGQLITPFIHVQTPKQSSTRWSTPKCGRESRAPNVFWLILWRIGSVIDLMVPSRAWNGSGIMVVSRKDATRSLELEYQRDD